MLDNNNSGFVLDVVHSREGCYIYLKEVEEGATEVLLGGGTGGAGAGPRICKTSDDG